MRHMFVDSAGSEIRLDGTDAFDLLMGVDGRLAPPLNLDSDPAVGRQGNVLRRARVSERDVELPIDVIAGDVRDKIRELFSALNPLRGDARLRVEYDDGQTRDLVGRVASIEAVEDEGSSHGGYQRMMVVFRAFDPYWRGDEVVRDYQVSAPDFFTATDGFPLQLAGATIIATVSEDNEGDADAWPVWTIRGPGVPRIEGNGAVIEFDDLTLGEGEVLEIDTEPGVKTVTLDGASVYDQLTLESSLFALSPGVNTLDIDLDEGTADSLVRLRYRPRSVAP